MTDLLERSRARGAAFSHTTGRGRWGLSFPPQPGLAVHAVVDGEVHLWTRPSGGAGDAGESILLRPGDLVLVRGGLEHRLGHEVDAPCTPLVDVLDAGPDPTASRRFSVGDAGPPAAVFFCGAHLFDGDLCAGLLRSLPDTITVRPPAGSALRATLDLMAGELQRDEPGQLDRLLDVALVQVLREHLATQQDQAPPWFRAQRDPAIGAALRALHEDPARRWTVGELASVALLSRAAFARRFTAVMGEAPLAYLTGWRMALARQHLRETDEGLAAIAAAVGYGSEFAFAAAFKRHHGTAPGRWRAEPA